MIYICEVDNGRRTVATENRNIVNVRNGSEVLAAMEAILRAKGLPAEGHTMRVYAPGRRPRLVQEVSA